MSISNDPFIFVSYSNKDASFVHVEINRLEGQGYRVWYDQKYLEPSRFWDEEIRKAITACTCFMVFITEDSVLSSHVRDEIDQALTANKPFIAVYWDNVELPEDLQSRVRKRQTLDRHSMHQSAYEGPLSKVLSEYISIKHASSQAKVPSTPPPIPSPDILPRVVLFSLIVLALICLFLAFVSVVTPNIVSAKAPDDLRNNRLIGVIGGFMFMVIAMGLGAAAVQVIRVYFWKRK